MLKKYTSKTQISINVVLKSGKSRHVSFTPLTGGGSTFYTDDNELQEAMAKHVKYGKLFKEVPMAPQAGKKPVKPNKTVATETVGKQEGTAEKTVLSEQTEGAGALEEDETLKTKQVKVTDADDAKNYLSEQFGISRTKMRSVKQIKELAAQNGIEFEGI